MSSCRMRRKRLIRPTRARKIDKLRLPHRPDKLAHRATYTCHVSFQLTHRQQLVGTACVIIDAADHLHLHFKTPCAGNHVAHCRNGIDVTAFQNPDITRKVGSASSTGPRVARLSALKRKCHRHRAGLRCPWLSPASDAPLAQPYLPDRPDSAPRLCHRQQ